MKRKIIFVINLLLVFVEFAISQTWIRTYNGPINNWDEISDLKVDLYGNVFVTGKSMGNGTNLDYCTIKYNSNGVQQWAARFDGLINGYDCAESMQMDNSGNIYVTGISAVNSLNGDYCTIKYNSNGIQQWVSRYSGTSNLYVHSTSLALDDNSNIYVSFNEASDGFTTTVKYDPLGVQKWVVIENSLEKHPSKGVYLKTDNSSNLYLSGYYNDSIIVVKYNSSGVKLWRIAYKDNNSSVCYPSAISIENNNIFILGTALKYSTGPNYLTLKFNSSGLLLWSNTYSNPNDNQENSNDLKVDNFGSVYVTGSSNGSGNNDDAITTIKYSASGNQEWVSRYYNSWAEGYSLGIDDSLNVYVVGHIDFRASVLKYNSLGILKWTSILQNYFYTSEYTKITIDQNGNIYCGGVKTDTTHYDYLITKNVNQTVGITGINKLIPETNWLYQNYPNPFNPTTRIKFNIAKSGNVRIFIYDVSGRINQTLVNAKLIPGTYEVSFDGAILSSGIYFCRMETESYSETKKLILMK